MAQESQINEYQADGSLIDSFAEGNLPQRSRRGSEHEHGVRRHQRKDPGLRPDRHPGREHAGAGRPDRHQRDSEGPRRPAGGPEITECHFDWGPATGGYPNHLPCVPAPPIAGPADVSAAVAGLTSGGSYHYRVVAGNADGTTVGNGVEFKTPSAPSVSGGFSSDLDGDHRRSQRPH